MALLDYSVLPEHFIDYPRVCAEIWFHRIDDTENIPEGLEKCMVPNLYVQWHGSTNLPFLVADVMEKELWKLPWRVRRLGYVHEKIAVYERMG